MILWDLFEYLEFLDNPGVYIMMMVFGLVLVPFYIKSINRHLENPEDYYAMSFEKKLIIGFVIMAFLIIYGLYNFMRFVH